MSFSGLLPAWVGDLDNVRRLIKICRRLPPFSGVASENRINRHIRYRGDVSVPRIEPRPGDDIRQPGGLLSTAQRRDRHVIQELEPAEQIICFLAARPARLPR